MQFLYPNDPPRSLLQNLIRYSARFVNAMAAALFFRMRIHGVQNYPKTGGMILLCNHQSNLDPILIGTTCPRMVNYLGKKTLFKFPPMGWLIDKLDCIPIDREGVGIAGMKETLRRLKKGESVCLFPEGQRTFDGEMVPFMTGFIALIRRVKLPIVPVGLDGAFQAWPRTSLLPKPGPIHIVVGKPIAHAAIEAMTEEEVVQYLTGKITECLKEAQSRYRKSISVGEHVPCDESHA